MSTNPAIELASTIQSASINRAPSPTHDINPSTAASQKIPVSASEPSLSQYLYDTSDAGDLEEVLEDGIEVDDEDGIPEEVLRPLPRRKSFGPLPDLRFEQSYLRSIEGCESNYGVAAVTIRDQVCLEEPFSTTFYSSIVCRLRFLILTDVKRSYFLLCKVQFGLCYYLAGVIGIERRS